MIKQRILNAAVVSSLSAAIIFPVNSFATNGMIPMGFGGKAKGMAGVSIALPQDATIAANNPAGMAHIGNRVDLGLEIFIPDRTGEISGNNHPMLPPGAANFRAEANNDSFAAIPEGGFSKQLNDKMTVGVSVVGVGGMNTNYDGIMMFNGRAYPSETGVDLAQLKIIPTLAYKVNNKHSLGIGLEVGYQRFKAYGLQAFTATGALPGCFTSGNCAASSSPSNVTNNGSDSAFGVGASIGWQGQITDKLTLGATYHSKTNMQEFDKYKGLFAEQGDLDMPSWFGFGMSYQVSPKLVVAADFTHTNYSDVKAISNKLQDGAPPGYPTGTNMFLPGTTLGENNGSGFGWDDVSVFKLGMAYQLNDTWVVRAGWSHGKNPIDQNQTFFNLLAPATIEDHITFGATMALAKNSELTFFGYHALNNKVSGSGSIPQAFGGGEANIEMSQLAFGIQYGWSF